MNILIVSATRNEIEPLISELSDFREERSNLYQASFNSISIDVLITGIGMVATSFYLGKHLHNKYDLAINLGIAGSFNRNIEMGSVVNIYSDRFSELGAEDGNSFLSLEEMNLQGESEIVNELTTNNPIIDALPKVTGITVNTVHGNEQSIETVINRFHPYTESMEGAAFLFACKAANQPCVQIRAISNYVEKRNRNNWNIPLAIANLNKKAIEILSAF